MRQRFFNIARGLAANLSPVIYLTAEAIGAHYSHEEVYAGNQYFIGKNARYNISLLCSDFSFCSV